MKDMHTHRAAGFAASLLISLPAAASMTLSEGLVDCLVDQKDVVEALPLMVSGTHDMRFYGHSPPPDGLVPDAHGMVRWTNQQGEPEAARIDPVDGLDYHPFLYNGHLVLHGSGGRVVHEWILAGTEGHIESQRLSAEPTPVFVQSKHGDYSYGYGPNHLLHPSPADYLARAIDVAVADPPSDVQVLEDGSTRLLWKRGEATRVALFEVHNGLQVLSSLEVRVEGRLVSGEYWSDFVEVGGAALPGSRIRTSLDRDGKPRDLQSWFGLQYKVLDGGEFQSLVQAPADEVIAFGRSIAAAPGRGDAPRE